MAGVPALMRGERLWASGARRYRLLGVLGALALTLGGCGDVTTAPSAGPSTKTAFGPGRGGSEPPIAASFAREVFLYRTVLPVSREANLYRVMVLLSPENSKVPLLHAANPHLKIFLLQNVLLSRASDYTGKATCTVYETDLAKHPDWFLKDQHGNRIEDKTYKTNYVMDVGNPAYQRSCVAHAIKKAKLLGFDGVYFDDASTNVAYTLPPGLTVPEYPNAAAWQARMYAFLRYAAAQLHAHHLLVMGNINGTSNYPGLWAKWNAPLDGAEEQFFTDSGTGIPDSLALWPGQLANAGWSQLHGKYALLHSYSTTEAGNTFGLATMLLVGDGDALYSTANHDFNGYEMWYPEYTTAERLGPPAGAYVKLANGIYKRVFANGIVLVNPTTSGVGSFSLGGRYSGSGLRNINSVSLGRASALIMTKTRH